MSEPKICYIEYAKILVQYNCHLSEIGLILSMMEDENVGFGKAILRAIEIKKAEFNDKKNP